MEKIKGIVKKVKSNKKGIQLDNGIWYSNNFKGELTCQVGDEVEVDYTINGDYKNYDQVVVTKKATISTTSTRRDVDPATMLVAYTKDLLVADMEQHKNIPNYDVNERADYMLNVILRLYTNTKNILNNSNATNNNPE